MRERGFTVAELLMVVIIIGLVASIGLPRLRGAVLRANVRSTRVALTTLVAKARAAAVQRGCVSTLHLGTDGRAWVSACKAQGAGLDTLGGVDNLADRFNVTLQPEHTDIQFDPRGMSTLFQSTLVRFRATTATPGEAGTQDSVIINPVGKVVR